ncbi:MAG: deoxyribonuclease IV [Deltaproteobacteria bacterium]|nr:deoxyribonuclease IV [Deltaproteobacteria bacterium]
MVHKKRINLECLPEEETGVTGGSSLLVGAHMSIEGGLHLAFRRGEALGCAVIQIFTKNASQWKTAPLSEADVRQFAHERERTGIEVIAHDAYLINLGSPDRGLRRKSREAFIEEMERAELLDAPYLVMHPGAHKGSGEDNGLAAVLRSLNQILRDTAGFRVQIVVENTAGQGTSLGYSFEHLRRLSHDTVAPERIGICIDTCHAFAAGYDFRDRNAYERMLEELDRLGLLDRIKVLHLNDSKKGLGSRVDRHEHIGLGMIGLEPFRMILTDSRFISVPKILETPKTLEGQDMDSVNLSVLRELASECGPSSRDSTGLA